MSKSGDRRTPTVKSIGFIGNKRLARTQPSESDGLPLFGEGGRSRGLSLIRL
jgi:hypothetical protein